MRADLLQAWILSGAVGLMVGTVLWMVRRGRRMDPSASLLRHLRAALPEGLVESVALTPDNSKQPVALELSREPTAGEKKVIDRMCAAALMRLNEDSAHSQ